MSSSGAVLEDSEFDRRHITEGEVKKLQWKPGMDIMYVITSTTVSLNLIDAFRFDTCG